MQVICTYNSPLQHAAQCSNYTVDFGGAHFFYIQYITGGGGVRALTMTYKDT